MYQSVRCGLITTWFVLFLTGERNASLDLPWLQLIFFLIYQNSGNLNLIKQEIIVNKNN